jgi:serine/threonine protein kinase
MLEVGQTIADRYQLQQKLGHNAGRQTWLAADLQADSELVIVKLLAFGDQVQWDDLKLFEREAQVLKQLSHPRIPNYRDYFSIDDRVLWFGLVQDYIPGTALRELIDQRKRFTEAEVENIAIELLDILIDLHELKPPILHRDIKPSNLILGQDQHIYLVDFGAVQDRARTEGATFTVVGTYGYTPLEQFGGRAIPASDLYALGATLIHLLTGVSPADLPQRNLRIQWRDQVTVSFPFADWIDQLIHPAIEERFATAREAKAALQIQQSAFLSSVSSLKVERPRDTIVKLYKSPQQLEIIIPKANAFRWSGQFARAMIIFTLSGVLPVILMVAGAATLQIPSTIWIALLILVVFILFISPAFEQTYIRFDRKSFTVERRRFRAVSNQIQGITADIQEVCGELSTREIRITSGPYRDGYRRYSFGRELTDFERVWVIKEIRAWLRMGS